MDYDTRMLVKQKRNEDARKKIDKRKKEYRESAEGQRHSETNIRNRRKIWDAEGLEEISETQLRCIHCEKVVKKGTTPNLRHEVDCIQYRTTGGRWK